MKIMRVKTKKSKSKKKNKISQQEHVYLDTSIQVKRLAGHPEHKAFINARLKNTKIYSSFYIRKEFYQSVLVPLIDFYFILKEEDNLQDATKAFADMQRGRPLKEITIFLGELLNQSTIKNNKGKALSFIKSQIYNLDILFHALTDNFVINETGFTNNKIEVDISIFYTLFVSCHFKMLTHGDQCPCIIIQRISGANIRLIDLRELDHSYICCQFFYVIKIDSRHIIAQ